MNAVDEFLGKFRVALIGLIDSLTKHPPQHFLGERALTGVRFQLKLEEEKRGGITLRRARRVPVLFLVSFGTTWIFQYCYKNADLVHIVPLLV